jgi:hypothetical protein
MNILLKARHFSLRFQQSTFEGVLHAYSYYFDSLMLKAYWSMLLPTITVTTKIKSGIRIVLNFKFDLEFILTFTFFSHTVISLITREVEHTKQRLNDDTFEQELHAVLFRAWQQYTGRD